MASTPPENPELKLARDFKSQGLTFNKAVIDAKSAFTHGQVFVVLSRCKTFEGMVFSSPIPSHGIETDSVILEFGETARQRPPPEDRLQAAKSRYSVHGKQHYLIFQFIRSESDEK